MRVLTDESFDRAIAATDTPLLVDFWAPWCGPCHLLKPVLEELSLEYEGRVVLAELDVDANPSVAARYSVTSVPVIQLFVAGALVRSIMGVQPRSRLRQELDALVS